MSIKLRPSRVLSKLRSGGLAMCVKANLGDPRVVEIAALNGFDCVWVDQEHVGNDLSVIENCIRAAKVYDCDTLVRVGRGSYSDLIRPLEMDAAGVMVPHVMSGAEASEVGRQTKFHPIGLRALDGGNADGAYTLVGLPDYIAHANDQRFTVVQIEDPQAVDDLDAIASAPGVDMLFFGPGDFSQAIGKPGQMDDERIGDARQRVVEAAQRHGKFAGTVASLASLDDTVRMGYRFVSVGADVCALSEYFQTILGGFAKAQSANQLTPTGSATGGSMDSMDSMDTTDTTDSTASLYSSKG